MDEYVVMAHPVTGDVVVVTRREFERVYSKQAADSVGGVEVPWLLADDPKVSKFATKEKIAAAALAAGIPFDLPEDGAGETEPAALVERIVNPPEPANTDVTPEVD